MDNYKSLLMETISKEDLVSKPAKIKRAGKLKEDLLPDEVYNTLIRRAKKTYTVGVYSTLPGPGWHYEINTEYGVYAKVPDDEGFIAHWFLQGLPQESEEKMESMAHYLIDEYDCKEVSLDEYKRIVNGKNESLKEDLFEEDNGNKQSVINEIVNYFVDEFNSERYIKKLKELCIRSARNGYNNETFYLEFWGGYDGAGNTRFEVYSPNVRWEEGEGYQKRKYKGVNLYDINFSVMEKVERAFMDLLIREGITPLLTKSGYKNKNLSDWYYKEIVASIDKFKSINESLKEDTVKTRDGKWTNKGKEGTHGKFRTKKAADAQRKAMFANGFKENMAMSGKSVLNEVKYPEGDNILYRLKYYTDTDGYDLDYDDGDWVSFDAALERALEEIKYFKEDGTDIKLIEIVKIITDEDGDEEAEDVLKTIPYNHKKYGWKVMSNLPSENHTSYVIHNIMDWGRDYTNYDTFKSIKKIAKACEKYDDEYTAEEYEFVIRNSGLLSKATKNSRYRWNESLKKSNKSLKEDNESLKEVHLGPYKYRYETHWINGRDVLLGASKTKDGAENIAYNQIEDILGNPWENDRNKYKIIDSLYIYDSENDDDDAMSMELEDYIDSILSELDSRIELKKESLTERYADDAVVLTAPLRKKLNKICYKYSGFHRPEEIAPMWKELYDLGIEVLIQGYPTDTAPGAKSWTVPFKLNGETVENSMFVYSVYEGSEGLKNDYNMYFS